MNVVYPFQSQLPLVVKSNNLDNEKTISPTKNKKNKKNKLTIVFD
jgi:hypothetical protein